MMARRGTLPLIASVAVALGAGAVAQTESEPPFGGPADVAYADDLWQVLVEARMAGEDAILTMPYEGTSPHGAMLGYLEADLTVGDHTGTAIVKRNYAGEGEAGELSRAILRSRRNDLASVTVMFRRAEGYDPENDDWFWVKYAPDGTPTTNPAGRPQAGRVAKGAETGCIACHGNAPGGDYIFSYDPAGG